MGPYYMPVMSTDMIWQTVSIGSEQTGRIGERLGKLLRPPLVIALESDLGGGKTTFVKGLARGLGVGSNVTSPTFTIKRQYKGSGHIKLYHYDFYRLNEPGIMAEELREALADHRAIIVMEWPRQVSGLLPKNHLRIQLERIANQPDRRRISLRYPETLRSIVGRLGAGGGNE